jgi:ribosomal protein L11 methyltransferase
VSNKEVKKFCFVLAYLNQSTIHLKDELASIALSDFECDGIEEFSLEESRVDEILGERAYSGGDIPESLLDEVETATEAQEEVTYKFFFYENNYEENAQAFKAFVVENFPDLPLLVETKDFEDWNTEWRKFYQPIVVSEDLEIIPEWLKETRKNTTSTKIFIYPGMGFGTGTHETTFLCMKLYSEIKDKFFSEMTCLDFGCGSGILGIAAIKTANMKTTFCDIDKNALDNCVQNIVLNFEGQKLEGTSLVLRDRFVTSKYNLVFANILEQVLILEKSPILDSLEKNGWLIVSGLLNHQVDSILQEYSSLKLIKVISKGDWSAILFRNEQL